MLFRSTWVNADASRKAKYGEALNLIKGSIEGRTEYMKALNYLNECIQGCELLFFGQNISALQAALQTADNQKISEAAASIKENIDEIYKDYNAPTDQKSMKAMLKLYRADVDPKFHPDFYTAVVDKKFKGNIDKFVDDMFARSVFASEAKLAAFLNKPVLKVIENDPVVKTFASIMKVGQELSKGQIGRAHV